ncbi:MAG TPA: NAD-dependent epimerase/dehydratase family protein [Myxococcales bacterium LLY-WYZ-16_1]|nr:NAD-dependent epimerase/dehydratase family protein [Myxococcales bacterium LLY-WYZ-16_1]
MARRRAILVTGAGGEMGTGLIDRLSERSDTEVLALDLHPLEPHLARRCAVELQGDILDARLIERLVAEFEIQAVFHLAALLSTRAEFSPETAHEVNVQGTLSLLKMATEQSRAQGEPVKFLFPSSIAVYGLAGPEEKAQAGRLTEDQFTRPITMYGCNKLACEHLGRYYASHYRQLSAERNAPSIDFRAIRFPGLISAFTLPHGGTSDFAPEMVHAAARGEPYACFVREDTRIPFMAMPDAIDGLLQLFEAPREALTRSTYNIGSFAPTALELADRVRDAFASADISFRPDPARQGIVDSWPADVDDGRARQDWGFYPRFDERAAFERYLVPNIRERYANGGSNPRDTGR